MKIKTYGVSGLVEWECVIPVGKNRMRVHFAGGAITAYGVTPAEFSTGDVVTQAIIENSEFYKGGRIELLRVVDLGGDDAPKRRGMTLGADATGHGGLEHGGSATAHSELKVANDGNGADGDTDGADNDADGDTDGDSEATGEGGEMRKVEVADLDEAMHWLMANFGYTSRQLRSRAAISKAAEANGVEFVMPE